MAEQEDFDPIILPEEDDEAEKKEIVDGLSQGSQMVDEDQTRSTLHTGDYYDGAHADHGNMPTDNPPSEQGAFQAARADVTPQNDLPRDTPEAAGSGSSPVTETAFVQTADPFGSQAIPNAGRRGSQDPQSGLEKVETQSSALQSEPASAATEAAKIKPFQSKGASEIAQNHAPEEVQLSSTTVAENASGAVVGTLSVIDPDTADSHSFFISDPRFEIFEGALRLAPGVVLDHEEAAQIEVEVTVTDAAGATLSQSFTINVADVNEAPTALTLENGTHQAFVAEHAKGAVIGKLSVSDEDTGDSFSFSVSDPRFEVSDGALRLAPGVTLDHEEVAQIEVDVTVTDSGGLSVTESFTVDVVDMPDMTASSGFHTQFFDVDHRLQKLDDIDWSQAPTHQQVSTDINYANSRDSFWEGGSTDTFGVQVNGNIDVSEGGTFEFHLGGDDGAVLYVNGQPVIDNDGLHGYRTRAGSVELDPGTHHIEVRYFENYGHAGLKLEWEGPGIDGRQLVTAPDLDNAQTVSGMPLTFNVTLDTANMPPEGSLSIDGLPPGTVVEAGDLSLVVDDSGSADITGWDTALLNVTPPVDFSGHVDAVLSLSVPAPDGSVVTAQTDIGFQVDEVIATGPAVGLVGGFQASYFDVDHTLRSIDDIDWDASPTHEEMVADINYTNSSGSFWEGGSTDTFGAKLEGRVTVEEGGNYTFFAGGDDGVVLFINGEPLIDNDGLHGFRTRTGEINLGPGTYEIELRYFENRGHAGLKLEWEGPGTNGRELVRPDTELSVEENGTWAIGVDMGGASEGARVELHGLPADTILISGENSAVSDGGPVDLTGWNTDMLEISPPPGFEGLIKGELQVTDTAFNGAEVTSFHAFSLAVGDVDAASEYAPTQDDMLLSQSSDTSQQDDGWLSDDMETDGETMDDDVMNEPAITQNSNDVADLSLETYERSDW